MKIKILLLCLSITMASCLSYPQDQMDRIEASIQKQSETLEGLKKSELLPMESDTADTTEQKTAQVVNYTLDSKVVLGEKEMVYLDPPGEYFDARIDTGATTSSFHASDVVWFERDGKDWVSFNMNHDGIDRKIEKKVLSTVSVQQVNNPEPVIRPVVSMFIIIGGVEMEVDFSLAQRASMIFPVLIGRNIMRDSIVVDVAHEYLHPMDQELMK